MTTPPGDLDWRRATPRDAPALCDLERTANLVGLAHVFAGIPFPGDEVLRRWGAVLGSPTVRVEVVDGEEGLVAYVAHDGERLRHLAVHPSAWGRGIGAAAVRRAQAAGARRLWVLEDNRRARHLYESLGWSASGITQQCPWAPHPLELDYGRPGPAHD